MTTLALPVSLAGDPVFFLFMQRVAGPGWAAARIAVRARQRGMGHTARFLAPGVRMTRIPFLPWLAAAVLLASGHAQAASPTSLKHTTFDFDPAKFPDPAAAVKKARALGYRVALWHVPYLDASNDATLALRDDGAWRVLGAVVALAAPAVLLLPGGTPTTDSAAAPLLGTLPLAFALPTIVAGFVASPLFDLTFHRAAQHAPSPRLAFLTFGATFAGMLLLVASFNDPATGMPRLGPAIAALWAVQLTFTVGAHLRELFRAPPSIRLPVPLTGALIAVGILLALPDVAFAIAPALGPGEPTYLGFLGAYGLLFPVLAVLEARGAPRAVTLAILGLGVPCYLLGSWEFRTFLMPLPLVAAIIAARLVDRAAKS